MLKRILKWLWEFVEVVIIVYVIFITSCILCRNKFGYTQFGNMTFVTVNDNNVKLMQNANAGELLIIKEQKSDINTGDLIYYYVTIDEKYVVKTGIVDSKTEDDYSALYVLRDDDKTSIASNRVIGKYVSIHPGLGSTLDVLESRFGFLFLVLLPILVVFIYQVYQLVIVARYEVVEDDDDMTVTKKESPKREEKIEEKKVEEKASEIKKVEEMVENSKSEKKVEEKHEEKIDDDVELL